MKLTIIKSDNTVSIDGVSHQIDLSKLDDSIHAVQWEDSYGEIERKDPITKKMVANEPIDSIYQFQSVIDAWNEVNQSINESASI